MSTSKFGDSAEAKVISSDANEYYIDCVTAIGMLSA